MDTRRSIRQKFRHRCKQSLRQGIRQVIRQIQVAQGYPTLGGVPVVEA